MTREDIGKRLTHLRTKKGQTKAYVARNLGLPYRTYCSYEYGERIPGDDVKIRIAEYYGLPVGVIFFEERNHKKW